MFTVFYIVYRSCTFSLWLYFLCGLVYMCIHGLQILYIFFVTVYSCMYSLLTDQTCTFSLWSCLKYFSLFTDPVHFLCGPVYSIIHCLQILYIFFVGLFTYFLLVDYQFYEITTIEIVCIVWIFTFIVDELYTVSLLNFSVTYSQVLKCKIYT